MTFDLESCRVVIAPPTIAQQYARWLRQCFGGRLVLIQLFGSYARGEAHEESDVDVLVVVRDLGRAEKLAAMEQAAEVALGQGVTVNALIMSTEEHERLRALESRLVLDIDSEGIGL
jgi:uncharacterized protein